MSGLTIKMNSGGRGCGSVRSLFDIMVGWHRNPTEEWKLIGGLCFGLIFYFIFMFFYVIIFKSAFQNPLYHVTFFYLMRIYWHYELKYIFK